MTTLNGAIRSYTAAVRRMERENQRRTREATKLYKIQQKQQDISNAVQAVQQYEDYVDVIQSVHKGEISKIDWLSIKNEVEPGNPSLKNKFEIEAASIKALYKPSFFDKIFGRIPKKIRAFDENIIRGQNKDRSIYENELKEYHKDINDWNTLQLISKGVINNVVESYKDAMEFFKPFNDISELGSRLNMKFQDDYIIVDLHINDSSIIPDYILTLTSTGKLSRKNMPISKFNEIYQDHVCSSALRIARESLAHLPIKFVIVNAVGNLLNKATGRVEEQPVLSLAVYPETFMYINFNSIDPSDSMINFIHNMKFSKTNGFAVVDRIDPLTIAK